jgi:hypothetical protein
MIKSKVLRLLSYPFPRIALEIWDGMEPSSEGIENRIRKIHRKFGDSLNPDFLVCLNLGFITESFAPYEVLCIISSSYFNSIIVKIPNLSYRAWASLNISSSVFNSLKYVFITFSMSEMKFSRLIIILPSEVLVLCNSG